MELRWRIQKNQHNGQKERVIADLSNPDTCPVKNTFQLVLRKIRLKHPLSSPLAVFVNKSGAFKYLTNSKIA